MELVHSRRLLDRGWPSMIPVTKASCLKIPSKNLLGPWAMIRQPSLPDSSHHLLHTYNYHIDSVHAPVFSVPGTRTLDKPYLLLYPASFQSPIRISIVQRSINKASGSTLYFWCSSLFSGGQFLCGYLI